MEHLGYESTVIDCGSSITEPQSLWGPFSGSQLHQGHGKAIPGWRQLCWWVRSRFGLAMMRSAKLQCAAGETFKKAIPQMFGGKELGNAAASG